MVTDVLVIRSFCLRSWGTVQRPRLELQATAPAGSVTVPRVYETHTALYPQSDGMQECYVKTVE
jgi:hypothetical protein